MMATAGRNTIGGGWGKISADDQDTQASAARLTAIAERLTQRLVNEAARRNSAYDHYGWGNTPETVDPDVYALLAQIDTLRQELTTEVARCQQAEQQVHILRQEQARLEAEADDWALMADGIKHNVHCRNHFAGDPNGPVCDRCRAEQAEQDRDAARAALEQIAALKLCYDEPGECYLGSGPYCGVHGCIDEEKVVMLARAALKAVR